MSQKFQLPRRTFLKGLGAGMALPWLEAMYSNSALAAGGQATAPLRMAYVFIPNGAIMPGWTPGKDGADYELSETLQPLQALKSEINVISGLGQDNGRAKGDGPGDHARCASTYLTGAHPVKTAGADIRVGVSVDQVAAEQIGQLTRLPSLEIGIEKGRSAGSCDSGYSCAYSSSVSWKTATTPMAKEINPRAVFERMFGGDTQNAERQAKRNAYRQSILDLVADDASRLQTKLGRTDRQKLDEYFTSVREIESRIKRAEELAAAQRPDYEVPEGIPGSQEEHLRLMYDMMLLAFQTDTTRIATFMLGNAGSNRSYRMVEVNEGHHQLSHHRNKEEPVNKLKRVDKFHITEFATFLEKLRSVKEGERTLLDNSMIVYGSGLSDSNRHSHVDLPIVLAGRGGDTIKPGRHIRLKGEVPLNNLFLSMLERMGAEVEELGDSTGPLSVIDA